MEGIAVAGTLVVDTIKMIDGYPEKGMIADISGISLGSALQRLPNPPAIVLMSSIPGFSLEAWKIQAFGFIEKPYTRMDVVRMVEKYRKELISGKGIGQDC